MQQYRVSIHLFRRDLRRDDNTALNQALRKSEVVVPVFVTDPRQVSEENPYRGEHALQFLQESLIDLDHAVRAEGGGLHIHEGVAEDVVPRLVRQYGAEAVFLNKDYTPFSLARDTALAAALAEAGVPLHQYDDALLTPPGAILTAERKPYSVFTPFYRSALQRTVPKPVSEQGVFLPGKTVPIRLVNTTQKLAVQGGATAARKIVHHLTEYAHYTATRDIPGQSGTTRLSAYLKFGCVSPRQVYWALRTALPRGYEPIVRQLYWRDFFTHIAFFHPGVFGAAWKSQYDKVRWNALGDAFEAWKIGKTGFPIVDAGMRELNETGWMHNRVRMITASFLIKDLHIDWREGERYFAQRLADYDPAVNNGSWQWVAGTGADAAPYFRVFNPWLQQKKFDPECVYIRRWVPELRDVSVKDIHAWEAVSEELSATHSYPAPICNHRDEAEETKRRFGKMERK